MHNLIYLQRFAQKLFPFKHILFSIALFTLTLSIYCLLIDNSFTHKALEPAIIATLWGLLLFAFVQLFQALPPPVLPHDGFFRRLAARIKLLLYSFLAVIVISTTVLLFWMSVRLLNL